jgi:hypothetical protein
MHKNETVEHALFQLSGNLYLRSEPAKQRNVSRTFNGVQTIVSFCSSCLRDYVFYVPRITLHLFNAHLTQLIFVSLGIGQFYIWI